MMRPIGHIRQRSAGSWEIRYSRMDPNTGRRKTFTATVKGDRRAAQKELRQRLNALDENSHVDPDKITLAQWVETWIASVDVGARTTERYAQLLRIHVVRPLGARRLQSLRADDFETLSANLRGKMSDRTRHHVHVVAGTCLRAAVRAGKLARNPIAEALKPRVEEKAEGDENAIGIALGRDNLARLSAAFADHPLSLLVATAISTGARRNEILALRWSDFDATAQTLRIVRALEEAKQDKGKRIRRVKPPKTREGKRTVTIDPGLTSRLSAERDRVLRIMAGVPKNATVDLSLIKLPENALIFPSFDRGLCEMRDANAVTRTFERTARKVLGLPRLRLHDLRHTHGSRLIAAGVPITAVAARMGHKPEVLLRCYAHEIKAAEERRASAEIIAALAVG